MLDYRKFFYFRDIPWQPYPVYAIAKSGRLCNFKNIIYPSENCRKKYTRRKQLSNRSKQARWFDSTFLHKAVKDTEWFTPVIREYPVIIQNSRRLKGQYRLYYLLDYYFPNIGVALELDSDYHDMQYKDKDSVRDQYLFEALGITTFRIRDLWNIDVRNSQEWIDITTEIKRRSHLVDPPGKEECKPNIFTNDLYSYLEKRGL